ncbi:FG-GAP repeat domain-containing protein [Ktedonospora formicarum]|uniref:VCBS repeat-containing protein n=1 Tax=Ktedonospora formicarum TaxID=2778364 RepID=A0A8J3I2S2_9CHLR|nr:VCBS repeat-containing protein [Ktedonospora formicarum]GHO49037.1 hypothetical protein KSX_72000 [Ktedonospora formicarum]
MSQEEMKKLTAGEKMGPETPGELEGQPQGVCVVRSIRRADSQPSFPGYISYPVGTSPIAVAVGDFTNDGNLDMVTANYHDNSVTVLQGNGDGTFQAPKTFPVGLGPVAVAVGDFTNDGNLGIVTANAFDDTVSVLQGKGDGTFMLYQFYATGAFPQSVAVGDFYYDGDLDGIVTADFSANTATVLLPGPPPLEVQANTIQATATVPFNGAVATITGARSASDTTVIIDWGISLPQRPVP